MAGWWLAVEGHEAPLACTDTQTFERLLLPVIRRSTANDRHAAVVFEIPLKEADASCTVSRYRSRA